MSDKYRDIELSDAKKVALLTKALNREKVARQLLENKISQINEQQFDATKEMLASYETARIRQIQLQFLAFMNREHVENKTVAELSKFFIENVLQLLGQNTAVSFQLKKNEIQKVLFISEEVNEWLELLINEEQAIQLNTLIPENNSIWSRTIIKDNIQDLFPFMSAPLLLIIRIPKQQNVDEVILINIEHYCYSDDFKHTLEIAANQFTEIVQKRSTEQMLSNNYKKLKHTLSLLKTTQQQLTHNEKMVSLGQLSAGVAHEINNPLSFLSSNLETLQDYIEQYDPLFDYLLTQERGDKSSINLEQLTFIQQDSKELLDVCLSGVGRMSEIVNNLKLFSKKDNETFLPTDLVEVIDASLAIVANQMKFKHVVDVNHSQQTMVINGNFGQLQQVFVNLFINAIHAMSEKGCLKVNTFIKNNDTFITVKDNGVGMTKDTKNRIFDPFYSTKTDSNGTGLGLSVSYAIITKHNASINVVSNLNEGTTFILKFPHQ